MGKVGDFVGGQVEDRSGSLGRMAGEKLASRLGLGTGASKAIGNIAEGLGKRAGSFLGGKVRSLFKFKKGGVVMRMKPRKGSIAAKRKMAAVRRYKKRR
jgi:hypothetical protein